MDGYEILVILLFVLSIIFFVMGYNNKMNEDAGNASVYYSIGFLLLILAFILFITLIGIFGIFNSGNEIE
jgi:hypothetical protein